MHYRLLVVAAFFITGSAHAQTSGTVSNHAFAIGKGAGTTGYTSLLCGSAQLAVGQAAADPICRTITGDVTIDTAGVTAIGAAKVTSAMLNSNVFSTGHVWSALQQYTPGNFRLLNTPQTGSMTLNASSAVATNTITFPNGTTDFSATGGASQVVMQTSAGGAFTVATVAPTDLSGLGTGVATFLATPSSANLRGALTDESGTGLAYFQGGNLGTPSAGVLTSATGLPLTTGVTGTLPIANGGTNDTGTAWTTFTPTVLCNTGSGTWTVNSAKSKGLGKTIFWQIDVTLTAVGTCATSQFNFTGPIIASTGSGGAGKETAVVGTPIMCSQPASGTTITCGLITGNLASSERFIASGVYESQ